MNHIEVTEHTNSGRLEVWVYENKKLTESYEAISGAIYEGRFIATLEDDTVCYYSLLNYNLYWSITK